MTQWDDRLEGHPVWSTLDEVTSELDTAERKLVEHEAGVTEAHARIRAVTVYARKVLNRTDPMLVASTQLDGVNNHLTTVRDGIGQFNRRGEAQRIINAASACDTVLSQLSSIPVALTPVDIDDLRDRVTAFRRSTSATVHAMNNEVQNAKQAVHEVRESSNELQSEINEQKGVLADAISSFENRLGASLTDAQNSLNEAISSFRQNASSEQQAHDKSAQDLIDKAKNRFDKVAKTADAESEKLIDEIKTNAEEQSNEFGASAQELIHNLNQKLGEAKRIVELVGEVGITGHYQRNAAEQRRRADVLLIGAGVSLLLMVVAGMFLLTQWDPQDLGWRMILVRAVVASPLGILAVVLFRQSGKHRDRERFYRDRELELATLDAYLEAVPDEHRHNVKIERAPYYFGGGHDNSTTRADGKSILRRKANDSDE